MRENARPAGNASDLKKENKRLAADIKNLERRNNDIQDDLFEMQRDQDVIAEDFAHFVAALIDHRGPLPFSLCLQIERISERLGSPLPCSLSRKPENRHPR